MRSRQPSPQDTLKEEQVSWTRKQVPFKGAELEKPLGIRLTMPKRRRPGRGQTPRASTHWAQTPGTPPPPQMGLCPVCGRGWAGGGQASVP